VVSGGIGLWLLNLPERVLPLALPCTIIAIAALRVEALGTSATEAQPRVSLWKLTGCMGRARLQESLLRRHRLAVEPESG
jgi:hypothetical protein